MLFYMITDNWAAKHILLDCLEQKTIIEMIAIYITSYF